MMQSLTKRQKEILDYLISTFISTSRLPTISEISRHFSFNKRASFEVVAALEKKGYLKKSEDGSLLLSDGERQDLINQRIPHFEDEGFSYIRLKDVENRPCFSMQIFSDEMKNIGLVPGDEGIFQKTDTAENGEIILCSTAERETLMLRRLLIRPDGLYDLIPENDTMGKTTTNKVTIHARLLMSIRRY